MLEDRAAAISLLRAAAERTVARGLALSPACSRLLATGCSSLAAAGGCPTLGLWTSARVRLLPCGRSERPGTSAILSRGADYGADRQCASLPIRPYL